MSEDRVLDLQGSCESLTNDLSTLARRRVPNKARTQAPNHEENPAWLLEKPTGQSARPPVNVRGDKLPFLDIGWENFERLCRRLAAASGEVEAAWAYGTRGQKQFGIDILVRLKDGGYEVWQTKRYERAGPADVGAAVELFLRHVWAGKAKRFVLVFGCPLERTKVIEAVESARDTLRSKAISFNPLDAARLTEVLLGEPEIIDDFFGRPWVEKVCPPEALTRLARRVSTAKTGTPNYDADVPKTDAGVLASLATQEQKLDALVQAQAALARREDISALARAIDRDVDDIQIKLPQKVADRELRAEFSRALRRRGFIASDTAAELADLARRAIDGDLSFASSVLRAEICERAARANAIAATRELALRFRNEAERFDASRDLFVVDAFLKEASGDTDAALRALKTRSDMDARSALFMVLVRQRGTEAALDWARSENFRAADFTPPAALNLVLTTISDGNFATALDFISEVPPSYFQEIPAMSLLRAQLTLASLLPRDQKSALFQGLPINPRHLQFADSSKTDTAIKAALTDITAVNGQASELGIGDDLQEYLVEFALWLRLEVRDFRDAARAQLAAEITNPRTTLKRVRLALAYDVPFDAEALLRSLARRKELGGWTPEERLAAFLIAVHVGDANDIASFFAAHRDDLFAQPALSHDYLAGFEVEALARAGHIEEARQLLDRYRDRYLTEDQAQRAEEIIAGILHGDEVERLRERYDQSKSLSDLRVLVGELRARRETELLATYAPTLARETRTQIDFDVAVKSLYQAQRDVEVVELVDDLPDQALLDAEYEAIKGWSLYRLGRLVEARTIARKLLASRHDANDRELAVNTAVETGDWGYLQGIVANEVARIDTLSAKDCIRLSRLAFETDSRYVNAFRDAALSKAPDDPQINLFAYSLAMESGEEERAHQWFQKAVAKSGPDGPVQTVSFREVINRTTGWRARTDRFDRALRRAELPMFMVAQAVNRRLFDVILGQARRNLDVQDGRVNFPVFAFSGARPPAAAITPVSTVAFDITALITLEYLGLLDRALSYFERVVIAPRTLSLLFVERQFLRVQQPSAVAKAQRIQTLVAGGQLKVVPRASTLTAKGKEIGQDLVTLLDAAAAHGGLVVRSAPVTRLGSYLEETADMSGDAHLLCDTHAVLAFLFSEGRINDATRQTAESYLSHVDKGWGANRTIHSSSKLYLDDLAVVYLVYVGLLDELTRTVDEVFVYEDVIERARQTLDNSRHADDLLTAIERIRDVVAAGVDRDRITFSTRAQPKEATEDEEDPSDFLPTQDLMTDLNGIEVVVADDRFLNKLPNWTDASDSLVPCRTTLDILTALRASGQLHEADYWLARHKLRAGGFYATPVELEEALHWLAAAPTADGRIRETPELRAIRESIALPQIYEAFLPSEEPWLTHLRFILGKAITRTWVQASDVHMAEARANWLLSIFPNPLEWCPDPDNEAQWVVARQQSAIQAAILMVLTEGKKERRRQYFQWLDRVVLAPIREDRPEVWDATVDVLKSFISKLWEVGDDDA